MGKITKKQFLADVMHEINAIKQHATDEEKDRLDFEDFDPNHVCKCIYGQMTYTCTSKRAQDLMDVSCIRQMNSRTGASGLKNKPFEVFAEMINGAYDKRTWGSYGGRNWSYLSALEGYINLQGAKNKEIIAYIKGERKTLTL